MAMGKRNLYSSLPVPESVPWTVMLPSSIAIITCFNVQRKPAMPHFELYLDWSLLNDKQVRRYFFHVDALNLKKQVLSHVWGY
jgi:hypothetical protein